MASLIKESCLCLTEVQRHNIRDVSETNDTHVCLECNSSFCKSCTIMHKNIPFFCNHSLMSDDIFNDFPTELYSKAVTCKCLNGHTSEFHCPCHCVSCCFPCFLMFHRKCENSERVDVLAKDIKRSTRLDDIHKRIDNHSEILQNMVDHKIINLRELSEQRPKLEKEISMLIDRINLYLFKMIEETSSSIETQIQSLENDIKELKEDICSLEKQKSGILQVVEVCSDSKTFLYLNEVDDLLFRLEESSEKMRENWYTVTVNVTITDRVEELLKEISKTQILFVPVALTNKIKKSASVAQLMLNSTNC